MMVIYILEDRSPVYFAAFLMGQCHHLFHSFSFLLGYSNSNEVYFFVVVHGFLIINSREIAESSYERGLLCFFDVFIKNNYGNGRI
jgi:hypothetical protein